MNRKSDMIYPLRVRVFLIPAFSLVHCFVVVCNDQIAGVFSSNKEDLM